MWVGASRPEFFIHGPVRVLCSFPWATAPRVPSPGAEPSRPRSRMQEDAAAAASLSLVQPPTTRPAEQRTGEAAAAAKRVVRWVRALYSNFSEFTADQERLISLPRDGARRFDYVEGFVVAAEGLVNNWRPSFFSPQNPVKLSALKHHTTGVLYCASRSPRTTTTTPRAPLTRSVRCSSTPPFFLY
jgi:hypothetical protein